MCAATSASRECDAARRGEENNMQASTGLIASNPCGLAFTSSSVLKPSMC
jgi:hypothetical protein